MAKPSVLLVCADDANIPKFSWQVRHAFELLGWQVQAFNYRYFQLHRFESGRKYLSSKLVSKAARLKPDLLLSIKAESILPEAIKQIRMMGIKTANWTLDEPFGQYGQQNKVLALAEYDTFFIFDDAYVKPIQQAGGRGKYLPCSSEPLLYHERVPFEKRQYICDAGFVGSHQPNRQQLLESLSGIDLKIWGYRWRSVSGHLRKVVQRHFPKADKEASAVDAVCKIWNSTKCCINIHHPQTKQNGANLRVFDLIASRSFQLCDSLPGMKKLLKPGKEIVLYESPEQLKELILFYKDKPEERKRVIDAAYDALLKRHRTIHRIAELLAVMGFPAQLPAEQHS